jgi:hypothetical protein
MPAGPSGRVGRATTPVPGISRPMTLRIGCSSSERRRDRVATVRMAAARGRDRVRDPGVEVHPRVDQPGVNWTSVKAYVQRCRIAGWLNDTQLRQVHPGQSVRVWPPWTVRTLASIGPPTMWPMP